MATYSETESGVEKHGIRAIKTAAAREKFASLWLKTATGLQKIYEAVLTCWDGKFWRGDKIWRGNVKW